MIRGISLVGLAVVFSPVLGIDLDVTNSASIKSTASTIANRMVSYYNGNETGEAVGVLPDPYYWWESGVMFDTLIRYWKATGDSQYNGIVSQGIQAQTGKDNDFMPANQTRSIANDDQAFWALAAMTATESKFPESQGDATWLSLADTVFNVQVARWDDSTCQGGLRWQIFPFSAGYDYKNSISNGAFFHLASRLARYTGNSTYSDWASKSFDWAKSVGFVDAKWNAFDGAKTESNCSAINKVQFSYVAGTFISGAAHMYNTTSGDAKWKSALDGLLNNTLTTFFSDGIAKEVACEKSGTCNTDMHAFKGILAQNLVDTIQVAPYTSSVIFSKLQSSATAAAKACDGGACTLSWVIPSLKSENDTNLGNELSALSFVQGLLVKDIAAPATATTGGPAGSTSNTSPTSSGAPPSGPATSGAATSGSAAPSPSSNSGTLTGGGFEMGLMAVLLGSVVCLVF